MQINVEERAEKASELFAQGYNCSQAVAMAFADIYGVDTELMGRIATSFGGGMGRMREVCGAVSGMFMVASLHKPADNANMDSKTANYAMVRELAAEYKSENGSIICKELLGLSPCPTVEGKKKACKDLVRMAAEIVGRYIVKEQENQ